jgi:hypothetical protein
MEQFEVEMREAYIAETVGSQVARDLRVPRISPGETRGAMSQIAFPPIGLLKSLKKFSRVVFGDSRFPAFPRKVDINF